MIAIDPPGYNDIPGLHTVQYIELAWTAIAVWGMTFSLLNLWNARKDRMYQRAAGENGVLELFTTGTLATETLRLIKEVGIFAVGVAAMLVEPTHPSPDERPVFGVIVVLLLFFFSLMTSLTANYVWWLRRKLERAKRNGL